LLDSVLAPLNVLPLVGYLTNLLGLTGGASDYFEFSGTSMAAPVVTGTVALMFQANPALTPNLVKAILQYTAEHKSRYNDLTQGAGFLNARGAVQVAKMFAASASLPSPGSVSDPTPWNRHINWGSHRIGGGVLRPDANAWRLDVTWGAASTRQGDTIVWGSVCSRTDDCTATIKGSSSEEDNIVWGTRCANKACDDVVWGPSTEDNIVWGTTCGGDDCSNAVWGTACGAQSECANVVWGASTEDNIVWGTSSADEDNIVWGTAHEVADARQSWIVETPRSWDHPSSTNRSLRLPASPSTRLGL
jgi:hypothetical protein